MMKSKFHNELTIEEAISQARHSWREIQNKINVTGLAEVIRALRDNKAVRCHIFSRSIAFRIGKSSIKSIPGWPRGFKSKLGSKTAKEAFAELRSSGIDISTDSGWVFGAACHFLIAYPDRVYIDSDSTDSVECEQILTTRGILRMLVRENNGRALLVLVGETLRQVDDIAPVPGRPKADMMLMHNGDAIAFISHKKGSRPGDFQQYGGFVSDLGIRTRKDMQKKEITRHFHRDVEKVFKSFELERDEYDRYDFNDLRKGGNFARPLGDRDMALTCMFGRDHESLVSGPNNCDMLIDGDIEFIPIQRGVYHLAGSYHDIVNPRLLKNQKFVVKGSDVYSPVMFLIKSEKQGLCQGGFSNVRAVVWPNNHAAASAVNKLEGVLAAIRSRNPARIESWRKELVAA